MGAAFLAQHGERPEHWPAVVRQAPEMRAGGIWPHAEHPERLAATRARARVRFAARKSIRCVMHSPFGAAEAFVDAAMPPVFRRIRALAARMSRSGAAASAGGGRRLADGWIHFAACPRVIRFGTLVDRSSPLVSLVHPDFPMPVSA